MRSGQRLSPLPVRERMKVRVRIQRYARVRILPNAEIEKEVGLAQSRIAGELVNCAKSILCVVAGLRSWQKDRSRILNRAGRCQRTLTLILSLTGRGDRHRILNRAGRCQRTLTFILSLTGRGDRHKILNRAGRCQRTLTFILSLTGRGDRLIHSRTCEALINHGKNFVDALQHLVIPEAKHAVAARVEKRGARFVLLSSLEMLRTVQPDDEAPFGRAEISEVGTDRKLTAEFGGAHLAVSQMAPQDSFGVGLFEPQPSRVLLGRFDQAHRVDCLLSGRRRQEQEQNPESRRALSKDPHLDPLPYRERRQRRNSESRSALYLDPHLHPLLYGERRQNGRRNH